MEYFHFIPARHAVRRRDETHPIQEEACSLAIVVLHDPDRPIAALDRRWRDHDLAIGEASVEDGAQCCGPPGPMHP